MNSVEFSQWVKNEYGELVYNEYQKESVGKNMVTASQRLTILNSILYRLQPRPGKEKTHINSQPIRVWLINGPRTPFGRLRA